MASFTAAQSSQTRPTSASNNKNNNNSSSSSSSNSDNNNEIKSIYGNESNYITENNNINNKNNSGITKKDYENGKSKQFNTDDPGAPTTTTNIAHSAHLRRNHEFALSKRDRVRAGNNSDSIEANAKIIDYKISAFKWPTEDSANSKATANASPNAIATSTAAASATAVATTTEAATSKEDNQFTTITKSTLSSKIKQNSETECLSNQGTLFTRLAINAAYTETEFANKEKLKLGDFNIPVNVGRRSIDQQSKYDYANKANAIPNGYKHRLLYGSRSESESDVGDPYESIPKYNAQQLYEFVCAITTATTIVAFICAIFANANSNATTKDTSRHGWDSVDRCRRAYVTRVHEWSNAYCYS